MTSKKHWYSRLFCFLTSNPFTLQLTNTFKRVRLILRARYMQQLSVQSIYLIKVHASPSLLFESSWIAKFVHSCKKASDLCALFAYLKCKNLEGELKQSLEYQCFFEVICAKAIQPIPVIKHRKWPENFLKNGQNYIATPQHLHGGNDIFENA